MQSNEQKSFTVKFPAKSFLEEARREYSGGNLFQRLLQELLQNSMDAGASQIDVLWDLSKKELIFSDNGSGMTLETLQRGLLTFAESIKPGENSVGGFGAAKKLILFSHPEWEVKTGTDINQPGICAFGGSIHYELKECEPIKGSIFRLKLDDSWSFNYINPEKIFKDLLSHSFGTVKATFNGENIPFGEKTPIFLSKETAEIREMEGENGMVIVRFNGLYMFSDYLFSNYFFSKSYYYDVIGSSRDALTQNREGFKSGTRFYLEYQEFRSTLSNNSQSGVYAEASFQKNKNSGAIYDGIQYSGDVPTRIRTKITKREKMIFCLCFYIAAEYLDYTLVKGDFGFYFDDNIKGLWADSKIWINPNYFSQTTDDDWIYDCIMTFFHEYVHKLGHGHNESFIINFQRIVGDFIKRYTGIAPIKAKMRTYESIFFTD